MRTSTVSALAAAAAGLLVPLGVLLATPTNTASAPGDSCQSHAQAGASDCFEVNCPSGHTSPSHGNCTGQNAAVLPVPGSVPAIN